MKPNQPSYLFILSVLVAMVSLFFSTFSPLLLLLVPLYLLPLMWKTRLPRDSSTIWGGRLFVYALCAVIGRAPMHAYYNFGYQAYVTIGLVLGGELILQNFREPPRGFKFDPLQFLPSGLLFAVGFCLGYGPHLWITAPLWVFLTLLAMGEVREDAPRVGALARVKQLGLIAITVCGGFLGHSMLLNNRNAITALGARLFQDAKPNVSQAGVADTPQMGSSFDLNASTTRLLRITGTLSDAHLRAAAFDGYDHGTWGPPISTRLISPALPGETRENNEAVMTPAQIAADPVRATQTRTDFDAKITVLLDTNKVMFAPLNSSALVPLNGTGFDWDRFQGPLQISDQTPVSYGIIESKSDVLGVQTEQGPLCVSLDPASIDARNSRYGQNPELLEQDRVFLIKARNRLLVVPPEIDPKVKQLALDITRDAPSQVEKIKAISDYLMKNYHYSLEFVRGPEDPVSDFLLHKKSAHCQYFAASAVMLLRSVGIPARYVTGFWAHEMASDGTTVVRGRDAHAWAEAFVEGTGWVTVEATPPAGRADPAASPLSPWQKIQEQLEDTWARVRNWFGNLSAFQIMGLMAAVLALWILERWRQARKKARALPLKPLPPLELLPLARGFERALQKRGITLLDGQTWSEAVPQQWQQGREWIELYNHARFDERDDNRLRALTDKLSAIERTRN